MGAGPALRGLATSPRWLRWALRVVDTTSEGHDLVEMKPAVDRTRSAKCTSPLRAASASCSSPSVGLGSSGAGAVWALVPVGNQTDTFNIVASVRVLLRAVSFALPCLPWLPALTLPSPLLHRIAPLGATASSPRRLPALESRPR